MWRNVSPCPRRRSRKKKETDGWTWSCRTPEHQINLIAAVRFTTHFSFSLLACLWIMNWSHNRRGLQLVETKNDLLTSTEADERGEINKRQKELWRAGAAHAAPSRSCSCSVSWMCSELRCYTAPRTFQHSAAKDAAVSWCSSWWSLCPHRCYGVRKIPFMRTISSGLGSEAASKPSFLVVSSPPHKSTVSVWLDANDQ